MHEDLNQKISQFLDNQLDPDEALSLLHKIQAQSELKNKIERYSAISHALKASVFIHASADFSEKISRSIEHEPAYCVPQKQLSLVQKPGSRRAKIIALAASLAVVAIIYGQSIYTINKSESTTTIQLAEQKRLEQLTKPKGSSPQSDQYPINARINDYLQAHDSRVYASDEANFRPFATVSAHGRE
jgi:sigma-E factor negative regulatory protein RseA